MRARLWLPLWTAVIASGQTITTFAGNGTAGYLGDGGQATQAEINRVRIKRIRQLLAETDLPLSKIAELVGYEHPEYMSVVYKRETGQTPGDYRGEIQLDASPGNPRNRHDR